MSNIYELPAPFDKAEFEGELPESFAAYFYKDGKMEFIRKSGKKFFPSVSGVTELNENGGNAKWVQLRLADGVFAGIKTKYVDNIRGHMEPDPAKREAKSLDYDPNFMRYVKEMLIEMGLAEY